MIFYANKAISRIANINKFITQQSDDIPLYCGWGRKKSFFIAESIAKKKRHKLICLEDGFIRSLGLGKNGYQPLSLVVDESGIYFDAFQSSDLEKLISKAENSQDNLRSENAIEKILRYKITKYNQKFKVLDSQIFTRSNNNILVVDQTFGDQSIYYAGATETTFQTMLRHAIIEHPDATIWVKLHPDVLAGKAKSHFSKSDLNHPNVQLLTDNYNPIELLSYINEVYVVSSQLGFEALISQKKVHCFGLPWYAGWGLTDDRNAPTEILEKRRGVKRSIYHLFSSAYFHYARYVNPITGERCECEDIIQLIIPNIKFQKQLNSSYVAYGFSPWKKKIITDFLSFPKLTLKFQRYLKPKKNKSLLVWGRKAQKLKNESYLDIITVEDGFIRSVGLGAKLVRPFSLVFDNIGIYYDATAPSKIENLLNELVLTDEQYLRAKDLKDQLVDLNISKYNVGNFSTLMRPQANHVILVVGQVEDDMSIQLGGIGVKTNLDLLKKVRENNPNSYIIYKPHPDVQEGLRVGKIPDHTVLLYADYIEQKSSILECFDIIDELHTITSLSGFEALLRGIKVFCYGMPFYAGWGLTNDLYKIERRCKNVNLETLIYVTLVEYPTYNLPKASELGIPVVRPEDVITYINSKLDQTVNNKDRHSGILMSLYNLIRKLG